MQFSAGQDVRLKNYRAWSSFYRWSLTLSRPGGHFVPPHLYHSISPKRLGVWSYCLVNILSMYIRFRKVQFHQSALMYVAMATMQLFGLFLNTRISMVFEVFPPERNFLWDNFLCFGHQNNLISSIKANIRSVTMETLQKILLPKYGIDTKTTD